MSLPSDINDRFVAAAVKAEGASEIIRRFSNDPEGTSIPTESGPLPSLAEVVKRNEEALGSVPDMKDDALGKGLFVLGRSVPRVDSISELRLVSGRVSTDSVYVASYHGGWNAQAVPHPVGGGAFYWDATSTEADDEGTVVAVDGVAVGRWKRPATQRVPLAWFGIRGDDSDETLRFQKAFAWADGRKVTLLGEAQASYRITNTVRLNNASLDFQGATVTFAHVGNNALLGLFQEAGFQNARVVCAGSVIGSVGNTGQRPIVALDSKNCAFRNIVFDGVAIDNIAPLTILGDVDNIDVENISIPGVQMWAQGVIIHWATTADSAVADFKDIAYSASVSAQTTHPRNIRIKGISCGTLTGGGALNSALFLSGVYNVHVDNLTLDSAARLLTIYPGDYAADFAPTKHGPFINTNIRVSNVACRAVTSRGIVVGGLGVLSATPTRTDVVIDGVQVIAPQTTYPLLVSYADGLTVRNGRLVGGQYVAALGESCKNITLEDLELSGGKERGLSSGYNNTTDNEGITVRRCRIFGNNTDATASFLNSGIYLERTYGATVEANRFGRRGQSENQRSSVYVASGSARLSGNHTYSAQQSIAYYGNNAAPYSMQLLTSNDTSDTSVTTGGHAWYESVPVGRRRFVLDASSGAPSGGTWAVGDELRYRTPVAGGASGSKCVVAGTPGTWLPFGYIPIVATTTYDPPSIPAGGSVTTSLTVTGATLGDLVRATFSNNLAGVTLSAYVSTAGGNCVAVFTNNTGSAVDLASGTLKFIVTKES